MQTYAVIGLGRFGGRLAEHLARSGREVIAIDKNPAIAEEMRDRVSLALALDATDEQALRAHGIPDVDAAIVGIGDNFEATTLATVLLKQLGVRKVIARASTRVGAQILERIGADGVVNPEDESADRWAQRLINPQFLNQIEFHEGYSIVEIKAPREWVGKTIIDLELRTRLHLHMVAMKRLRAGAKADAAESPDAAKIEMPVPTEPLREGDILILMGKDEDLARLPHDGG